MYDELYEAGKLEIESAELQRLSSEFYKRLADYIRKISEERRMLDKKTVKARLLQLELRNVRIIIKELVQARYRKLVKKIIQGEKIPLDTLTIEEERLCKDLTPLAEAFQDFLKSLLRGQASVSGVKRSKTVVLRFLKDVPAIIGADMKTYGSFKAEDVSNLPAENAKILVKQGLAERVEVQIN